MKTISLKFSFLFLFLFFLTGKSVLAQYTNDSVKSGSYIINMGVVPQTKNNGLRPYGLIYELIRNRIVPVKWIINPLKVKDGNDFHHNGIFYKGGAFIIPKEFITSSIQSLITTWNGLGVAGAYTVYDTILPVYATLTSWPRSVLDSDNGNIVEDYYADAGISPAAYSFGLPSSLNVCNDLFALPHADPEWNTHGNFYDFVTTNKGYIWAACHAVSVLESIKNPSNTIQLNFLSGNGLQCYSNNKCFGITQTHAGNPTAPVNFISSFANDPVCQYIGDLVPATNNGSEEWFIPLSSGAGWNSGVKRIIQTSDGVSGKEGIKLAYGSAYNNTNYGKVMYMGGHDHGGNGVSNIAAQRAFFNFVLLTGEEKKPKITLNGVRDSMGGGNTRTFSVNITGGTPPYTYLWTASAGILSNPAGSTTQYTAPVVALGQTLNVVIRCQVTDGCNRWNFNFNFTKIVHPVILSDGLKEFNADGKKPGVAELNWKLAEHNSTNEIIIERSINGRDFIAIDRKRVLDSKGFYSDRHMLSVDNLYYRLKLVYADKTEYSHVAHIQNSREKSITVFPNPASSGIFISGIKMGKNTEVLISDLNGVVFVKQAVKNSPGMVYINGLELLKPGIYIVKIYNDGVYKHEKLIIK